MLAFHFTAEQLQHAYPIGSFRPLYFVRYSHQYFYACFPVEKLENPVVLNYRFPFELWHADEG